MRVSIIITNYNYSRYLTRAIQSSLNQNTTQKNFYEVIVVDDFSKDKSKEVIKSFGNDIIPIYNKKNYGLPYSINKGILKSKGIYILRLDADDWIDNNCISILAMFLDKYKNYDYVWPDYNLYDKYENVIAVESNPLGAGVMFRKQLLVDIGLYDEKMLSNEDKDILIRCQKIAKGYHLKLPLYKYFKHGKSMTNDQKKMNKYTNLLKEKHNV